VSGLRRPASSDCAGEEGGDNSGATQGAAIATQATGPPEGAKPEPAATEPLELEWSGQGCGTFHSQAVTGEQVGRPKHFMPDYSVSSQGRVNSSRARLSWGEPELWEMILVFT
jgi:hypothetical protein